MKILLVEDNEMNRDMLSRRLIRKGHEVVMAFDGEQGFRRVTRLVNDCALQQEPPVEHRRQLFLEVDLVRQVDQHHVAGAERVGHRDHVARRARLYLGRVDSVERVEVLGREPRTRSAQVSV